MTGIIILNYNNAEQTLACLDSIRTHCHGDNFSICVVDNASRSEELAKLKNACKEKILVSPENKGYACGNNIGCEYFDLDESIDKILILNDDTRFTRDIITPMEKYLDSHPECGVVFPLVLDASGNIDKACARRSKSTRDLILQATCLNKCGIHRREFLNTEGLKEQSEVMTQVPPGSCMMLPKDLFKKIGWLDPNTFLYFEEHILSEKLKRQAKTCILLPEICITHLGALTTSRQNSKVVYKHWRNSYLYYMKNFSQVPKAIQQYLRFRTWIKTLL